MSIGRVSALTAIVVGALVACSSYGEEADAPALPNDSGATDAQSSVADVVTTNDDSGNASDGSDQLDAAPDAPDAPGPDGSTFGPGDVSAACIRVPNSMKRVREAHVLSVYGANTGGVINVAVLGKDLTLVLASFDAVSWKIDTTKGSVAKVYVDTFGSTPSQVTGLDANVPITPGKPLSYSYGYTRKQNLGGGNFGTQIAGIRTQIGGLETTYQGIYTGTSFNVGGSGAPTAVTVEHYDTRVACNNPCLRNGTVDQWTDLSAHATVTGLTINTANGSNLRVSPGAQCGKHYFELKTTAAGMLGIAGTDFTQGASSTGNAVDVPADAVVAAAVDLDANTVSYTLSPKNGPATTKSMAIGLWLRESVGPAFSVNGSATVTLFTRPPFTMQKPDGFVADY